MVDKDKFKEIKNRTELTKPFGGFWGSRLDTTNGWKNWCEDTEFETNLNEFFIFTLSDKAKVLIINDCNQLNDLPKRDGFTSRIWSNIDFEKLSKKYDAIEVLISQDSQLYFQLYGWDCDSILVMNPDIVIEEGKKIEKELECNDLEIDL